MVDYNEIEKVRAAQRGGHQSALALALDKESTVKIAAAAGQALYAAHKAAGKPLPTANELSAAKNAALQTTREKIVARNEAAGNDSGVGKAYADAIAQRKASNK